MQWNADRLSMRCRGIEYEKMVYSCTSRDGCSSRGIRLLRSRLWKEVGLGELDMRRRIRYDNKKCGLSLRLQLDVCLNAIHYRRVGFEVGRTETAFEVILVMSNSEVV